MATVRNYCILSMTGFYDGPHIVGSTDKQMSYCWMDFVHKSVFDFAPWNSFDHMEIQPTVINTKPEFDLPFYYTSGGFFVW